MVGKKALFLLEEGLCAAGLIGGSGGRQQSLLDVQH
jgi:hypothetical protein